MMTGDSSVNADAPIICCTAEILANLALRHGEDTPVGQVVMDEFHFYSDPDRGWAWQVPLLTLSRAQFILMSATLGDVTALAADLTRRTARETAVVTGVERPVPLHYFYEVTPVHETVEDLLSTGQAPIYIVHFSQLAALERAQALSSATHRIPGAEGCDRRPDRRVPVHDGVRQDAVASAPPGHRRAPRRHAAQVPPARRAARPARDAPGHLRNGHTRASASTCRSAP